MPTITTAARRALTGGTAAALMAGALAVTSPLAHAAADPTVSSGTLTWGLKESFRSYLTGPIAHGSISATAPATDPGTATGATTFPNATGTWGASRGAISTRGSVRYVGHGGDLDLTVTSPQLVVTGSTARLLVDATDSSGTFHDNLAVATVDLTGRVTRAGSKVTITAAPATLTKDGENLFLYGGSPMYPASTVLAPVSASFTTAVPTASKATKVAAAKPRLKITKKPTTKKKGKAVVTVARATGKPKPTGKVRIKLTKGKKSKFVTVNLSKGKRVVTLPKLAKGTWTVRVAYYGNTHYKARAYTKAGKVKITK